MPNMNVRGRVLDALRKAPIEEPDRTARELAYELGLEPGPVVQALYGLEGEGVVRRAMSRFCAPQRARWVLA
jgi:hypothetical protein